MATVTSRVISVLRKPVLRLLDILKILPVLKKYNSGKNYSGRFHNGLNEFLPVSFIRTSTLAIASARSRLMENSGKDPSARAEEVQDIPSGIGDSISSPDPREYLPGGA
jgi:hypothetical protein